MEILWDLNTPPVLFSHPQLSIDPARETTLCSALRAERGKKIHERPGPLLAAVAIRMGIEVLFNSQKKFYSIYYIQFLIHI